MPSLAQLRQNTPRCFFAATRGHVSDLGPLRPAWQIIRLPIAIARNYNFWRRGARRCWEELELSSAQRGLHVWETWCWCQFDNFDKKHKKCPPFLSQIGPRRRIQVAGEGVPLAVATEHPTYALETQQSGRSAHANIVYRPEHAQQTPATPAATSGARYLHLRSTYPVLGIYKAST